MEIRLLNKADLETNLQEFCDLYHSCFSDKIDANIVRQRYLENPLDELQMCVAIDKNKIVAATLLLSKKIKMFKKLKHFSLMTMKL